MALTAIEQGLKPVESFPLNDPNMYRVLDRYKQGMSGLDVLDPRRSMIRTRLHDALRDRAAHLGEVLEDFIVDTEYTPRRMLPLFVELLALERIYRSDAEFCLDYAINRYLEHSVAEPMATGREGPKYEHPRDVREEMEKGIAELGYNNFLGVDVIDRFIPRYARVVGRDYFYGTPLLLRAALKVTSALASVPYRFSPRFRAFVNGSAQVEEK